MNYLAYPWASAFHVAAGTLKVYEDLWETLLCFRAYPKPSHMPLWMICRISRVRSKVGCYMAKSLAGKSFCKRQEESEEILRACWSKKLGKC